jgi:hypothetical protein
MRAALNAVIDAGDWAPRTRLVHIRQGAMRMQENAELDCHDHFMKAELLEREFAARGVPHDGGLLLLKPSDAIALVRRAAEEGVPVLGVDGFVLTSQSTQSPLEHLADYSQAVADGHGCWQAAESFIRAREGQGLAFEITLGDDPVEAV